MAVSALWLNASNSLRGEGDRSMGSTGVGPAQPGDSENGEEASGDEDSETEEQKLQSLTVTCREEKFCFHLSSASYIFYKLSRRRR